jgi:hypothetical protein
MLNRKKKVIAGFFLVLFSLNLLVPTAAFALTSGPTQPEMTKFQPAGASDLVNLFTGDMNYNIPLLDVGGYPVNVAYQAGTSMDEEASWVGTGWTLNPGAVNRNMRGLPDDFDGTKGDKIEKTYSRKEFKKVGGQVVIKPSIAAWEKPKSFSASVSFKVNVYKDNYYGIGASVGGSLGFSLASNKKSPFTTGLDIGVNSDTRGGASIAPNFSVGIDYGSKKEDVTGNASLAGGFEYNSRSGLKNVSLSPSFSTTKQYEKVVAVLRNQSKSITVTESDSRSTSNSGSAVQYFGQSYSPIINCNTENSGYTFSFDLGPSIFGGYLGLGGAGYVYKEKIKDPVVSIPAFGYLNYLKGRKNENALLDFNREKDGVFLTSAPSIPIPVATQDYFMATGQTGSQQFRPYFGGNYIVFDRANSNVTKNLSAGATIGGGNLFKGGGRIDNTKGKTETRKWVKNNNYLSVTEAAFNSNTDPLAEPVFFKQVGEPVRLDEPFLNKIGGNETVKVAVNDRAHYAQNATAYTAFKDRDSRDAITSDIKKTKRDKRNTLFSYLTADQASNYGLDKMIKSYTTGSISSQSRVSSYHKGHHISEITVTDNSGKRMVYGIPVLNKKQEEVSFSVAPPGNLDQARRTGIISYSGTPGPNQNGREWLYTKEVVPAYATSYLLTGILSPDYVDVNGNGISDDDPGTAIKFNYTKLSDYKWRAPYNQNTANYNEGFISDPKDDKASYVYGEKETWYMHSIESKTMIAIFETSDRQDGLGVLNANGGQSTNVKLKKLDRIKLYSKPDWLANGSSAVPIKVVHFEYDYSLYPDVSNNSGVAIDKQGNTLSSTSDPNNVNIKKGKLTLKKVYFTFGTSTKGISNPYEFEYDERLINPTNISNLPTISGSDDEYADKYFERQSDRWGTYKKSYYNRVISGRVLNNSEFPYSAQENINTTYSERLLADRLASKWQLNKITTPSGSIITIDYEADDYAYVQNRKAMQMCFLKGIQAIGQTNGLINADKLVVELPRQVSNVTEFKNLYLKEADGRFMDKLFYKISTDLNGKSNYEYVHGYAEIDYTKCSVSTDGKTAFIGIKKHGSHNPVAKAAWQMLRSDLPQYAYEGYDNSDVADGKAAIVSIIKAFGNLKELTQSFEEKAVKKGYADIVNWQKSMVRLGNPGSGDPLYSKIGGGLRVKKVMISDEWAASSGISGSKTVKYGQLYDYSIRDRAGNFISSSGVAAYEPQIGNEENPFHEPVSFTEKVHWSSDRYHYIEKPYCESYFPAASVGYSKVTVTSFGDDYATTGTLVKHTGHIENEFYTAKDFPTIVDNLTLDQTNYKNSIIVQLFSSQSYNKVVTSQGFKIELNDMHGKPKSVKVYNKGGDVLSSSEYFYNVKDQNAEFKELKNEVDVLNKDGSIQSNVSMATDVDFTTDIRQSESESVGTSIGGYVGGMLIPIPPPFGPWYIPYGAVNYNKSITVDNYNSVSSVKVIHRFGILKKVKTIQNGSTTEAENLLWDQETGQVLLTRTQNEYDKDIYTFSYPAYMVKEYEGMDAAYHNAGMLLNDPLTGSNGLIKSSYSSLNLPDGRPFLFPGDELINISSTTPVKGWVVKPANAFKLIDKLGADINEPGTYMLVRSGRRNLTSTGVGTVICLKDPRVNGQIKLDDATFKVLDSKVLLYKDQWPINAHIYNYSGEDCAEFALEYINPFFTGILGNWRPDTSFVYMVNREQIPGNPSQPGGTDIRNSGYYSSYAPFWKIGSTGIVKNIYGPPPTAEMLRWTWTSRPVYYDASSNMVESETPGTDPANPTNQKSHFGSALYGYQRTLPVAVAANSRLNEMTFDGFEDYNFESNLQFPCPVYERHFSVMNGTGVLTSQTAHSGKYSWRLSSATAIGFGSGYALPSTQNELFDAQANQFSYNFSFNSFSDGFRPINGKKYLMSFWVNDHAPTINTIQNLTVKINGVDKLVSNKIVPVVEGWKKLDIEFVFTDLSGYELEIIPGATIEIDDFRILPLDGQMTSYVYDERTLRLVAQLDENNFASFYEYDEEGVPIRVKKETDRGIMTLKENRQSVRKRN